MDPTVALCWLTFWLVFSAIAGAIASNKGRSGFGVFLVALLLSPVLGILIALALQPNTARMERAQLGTGASKRCLYCAELIKFEARVCRFCGKDVEHTEPLVLPTLKVKQANPTIKHAGKAPILLNSRYLPRTAFPQDSALFLWLNGEQTGPFTVEQIQKLLAQRKIVPETLTWKEGMAEWMPLGETAALGDEEQRVAFACPRCTEKLEAASDQSGTAIACPVCQFKLTVPNESTIKAKVTNSADHRNIKFDKKPMYMVMGFGAIFLVVAIMAAISIHSAKPHEALTVQPESDRIQQEYHQKQLLKQRVSNECPELQSYIISLKESVDDINNLQSSLKSTLKNAPAIFKDTIADNLRDAKDRLSKDSHGLDVAPPSYMNAKFLSQLHDLQAVSSSLETELGYVFTVRASQHDANIVVASINENCSKLGHIAFSFSVELDHDLEELVDPDKLGTASNNAASTVDSSH